MEVVALLEFAEVEVAHAEEVVELYFLGVVVLIPRVLDTFFDDDDGCMVLVHSLSTLADEDEGLEGEWGRGVPGCESGRGGLRRRWPRFGLG